MLLSLLIVPALTAGNAADDFTNQLISSQEIAEAGLFRLSDLFMLVDNWDGMTIDGFSWGYSVNGLSPEMSSRWIVMIDGQRMDVASFDLKSINTLPISISSVDSIRIISTPQIHEGEFSDGGLIHFYTRPAKPGLSLQGKYGVGNETGEPGPYRYTEYYSPNVDRIGADEEACIAWSRENYSIGGGWVYQDHYLTDPAMRDRCHSINNYLNPKMESLSYHSQTSVDVSGSRHNLFMGCTDFSSMQFLKAYGREIPMEDDLLHIGLNGFIPLSDFLNIRYRTKYSRKEIDKRDNTYDIYFNWIAESYYGNVEAIYSGGNTSGKAGAGLHRTIADGAELSGSQTIDKVSIYGEIERRITPNLNSTLGAYITVMDGESALKSALSNLLIIREHNKILVNLAFAQQLPGETWSDLYWADKGFLFPGIAPDVYSLSGELDKSSYFSSDLTWKREILDNARFSVGLSYRYFMDYPLEAFSVGYDTTYMTFPIQEIAMKGTDGQVLTETFSVSHDIRSRFRQRLSFRYNIYVEGDDIFEEQWNSMPQYRLSYTAAVTIAEGCSIWGKAVYLPARDYYGYGEIETLSSGLYSGRLDDLLLVDLSFQKYLWKSRLWFNLGFRNIFDEDTHLHPIGASQELTFFIQLRATFDSILN